MTPGNRDPKRYALKTTLSVAVAALIAAGASQEDIYSQFLHEKEGSRTTAYLDSANIWTICRGLTRVGGRPVFKGQRLTEAECDRLDREEQARGLEAMERLTKPEVWGSMSPAARAGAASFCVHNIGETRCKASTFLRLLNEGQRNDACAQITLWIRDGGKDCRDPKAGCAGQVIRRPQEDELCLTP